MRNLWVGLWCVMGMWSAPASRVTAQEVVLVLPDGSDNLRAVLENAALLLSLDQTDASGPQDYVAAARADYRRLLTGLYAEGHYGGAVSITIDGREAAALAPLDAPGRIGRVVITVDPGPLFTFGSTEVAPLAPGTLLPESFAPGLPARSDDIRTAVRGGVDGWRDLGHAKAEPAGQEIIARHIENRLDVAVAIAPGPRLNFGAITVTGNDAVRTARILEIAGLPMGGTYDPQEVEDALTRLRRTGTFQSVALIESEGYTADLTLPFELQVIEQKPRRLGFGAEVSSLDGLSVNAFWLHRNLFGGAERFRAEASVSGIGTETGIVSGSGGVDYTLGATFARPATFNRNVDLQASVELSRLDEEDYLLDQFNVEVGLIQYVSDLTTYELGVGLLAAHEETEFRTRDYALLTLPAEATRDLRDDPFDPNSGYYINLELTPFIGLYEGADGGRIYADARVYRSFGADDRFTLAARAQLGSVIGPGIFDAPADFLFYSGGGGTVRGQPYQSLGISLARDFGEGARIGGASFAGAQLEARVDITDTIGVVGFYDYGYISAESTPLTGGESHAGAGLGVRYDTPIGPIRLDLATPVTGDDAYGSVQIYLGIGQSF